MKPARHSRSQYADKDSRRGTKGSQNSVFARWKNFLLELRNVPAILSFRCLLSKTNTSNTRIKKCLGREPGTRLRDGMEKACAWI
jgi:hypothetical protein